MDGRIMPTEQECNLDLAKLYEELYNTDTARFVHECYTTDCEVNGGFIRGHEQFDKVESAVLAAAPNRIMRVARRHASGNVVVVEAVLLDPDQGPDWKIPFCAVLTCRDGKIASDWTYADFTNWPGITDL